MKCVGIEWTGIVLVMLSGCCGPVKGVFPPSAGDMRELFVMDNHWHTGLILRTSDLSARLKQMLVKVSDAPYVEIGWGDDRFYRSPESTSGLAVQAMFASRGSVIHAVPIWSPPEYHYLAFVVDLYKLQISSEGQRRLLAFIEDSFERTESGGPVEIESGWAPGSWFYRARGRYSALHTCNQWTADALRSAGFPITPIYASTAGNVGWQVRTFSRKYEEDVTILQSGKPVKPLSQPTTSPATGPG